ncbi:hypothetical protein B0A54_05657 [Friedmanniomyces endolithicus]|uniref:Uncharacterized protein n=1 Tax=Friedmanniomyces endolithicus TaxID=329885 RepID=A0A4U0V7I7_9PEZI|nr:hypothetical protein LTS09_015254 [Friedmanniomyces endolithicus]TKA43896.1 hypothetical protein B0A54_05657 [Friedmanniomyces endolithicus]
MQRNHQNTSPTPRHQQRSHARHQQHSYQPSFTSSSGGEAHSRGPPNRSVHIPPRRSSNRFEVLALATPPPEVEEVQEFHVPAQYRRSRTSRGTKEAKRRRDGRRSQRKMAAQRLDEQLSRQIDFALSKVNGFPTPPSSAPSPTIVSSTGSMTTSWSSYLPQLPPSPPQLPPLDFNSFGINVNSFLEARAARGLPRPPTPLTLELPSWCPPLPCLTRKGVWSEGLPVFYDLSSLPEPKEAPKPQRDPRLCQELQLWSGKLDTKPRQSRFFPRTPAPAKPTVTSTSSACTLHATEQGLPAATPSPPTTCAEVVKKGVDTKPVKHAGARDETSELHPATPSLGPSPANLWNVLADVTSTRREPSTDPYLASFLPNADDSYQAAWVAHLNTINQSPEPVELDGREIPYVHANSLTGHSNEVHLSPYADEHPALSDSGVCFTPLASPPLGLNELVMDYDIGLPYSTPPYHAASEEEPSQSPQHPSSPQHSLILADILPINCIQGLDYDDDGGEQTLQASDAHFHSEKSLLSLGTAPEKPTPAPNLTSTSDNEIDIDIATFLKMGHASHCWCTACSAPTTPEQREPLFTTGSDCEEVEADTPELVAFDRLTGVDDDWMLYSPPTGCSADDHELDTTGSSGGGQVGGAGGTPVEGAEGVVVVAEAKEVVRTAPVWEDYFPCRSRGACEVQRAQVLGCEEAVYLGGVEEEDEEWVWEDEH